MAEDSTLTPYSWILAVSPSPLGVPPIMSGYEDGWDAFADALDAASEGWAFTAWHLPTGSLFEASFKGEEFHIRGWQ